MPDDPAPGTEPTEEEIAFRERLNQRAAALLDAWALAGAEA